MFALIVLDRVLLFDFIKHYGMFKLETANLSGYKILSNFKEIITYYKERYFNEEDVMTIEQYFDFLYRVCLKYLKDYQFLYS